MKKYLLRLVRKYKSTYYYRYARKLSRRFAVHVTTSTIYYWLKA